MWDKWDAIVVMGSSSSIAVALKDALEGSGVECAKCTSDMCRARGLGRICMCCTRGDVVGVKTK